MNVFHNLPDKIILTDSPVLQNSVIQNHKIINRSHKTDFKKKLAELEENCVLFDTRQCLHCPLQIQGSSDTFQHAYGLRY